MPRKTKEQRLAAIHAEALERFEESYKATQSEREMARIARRFVNLPKAQWEWDERGDFNGRMRLEIDQIGLAITRIRGEYRRNLISAEFVPSDGTSADALAEACAGLYRADTWDSRGRAARRAAFDSAVEGGFGGIRLIAEEDDDGGQRIRLRGINDAESSLFFDLDAEEPDKSDAEFAFLIRPWTRRAFVARYGEECSDWPAAIKGQFTYPWFSKDVVRIAEYFVKEDRTEVERIFTHPITGEEEELDAADATEQEVADLLAQGYVEGPIEKTKVKRVIKYVMNGAKVLEGPIELPFTEIPLVPQYGHRTVIDMVERFRGHVQKAIDTQIAYNIQVSKVAETAAASGVEKPIFLADQIKAFAEMWARDAVDNPAYLLVGSALDAAGAPVPPGPVGYTRPPALAPAVAELINLTKRDLSDMMGSPENGERIDPAMSGVAVDAIQGRIDMQSYVYLDEAASTERRVAEVWLSAAPTIYGGEGRTLKTLAKDGTAGTIETSKEVLDEKTGKIAPEVSFDRVKFDVSVDVGPTSASRRSAVVRTITDILGSGAQIDPETSAMLLHVALSNMEGEGLSGLRAYSRKKLVAMGVEKPTRDEQEAMDQAAQAQQPDPQAQLADAMAEEARAKAMEAQARTGKAIAESKLAEARAAEALAGIPIAQQESAVKTAKQIAEGVMSSGGQ